MRISSVLALASQRASPTGPRLHGCGVTLRQRAGDYSRRASVPREREGTRRRGGTWALALAEHPQRASASGRVTLT
jgi:hypothetical protein